MRFRRNCTQNLCVCLSQSKSKTTITVGILRINGCVYLSQSQCEYVSAFFLFSLKERVKEVIRICHWSHHLFYTKGVVSLLVLSSAVFQTALVSILSRLWGPFLESPDNFSGPKSNFRIELQRIRGRVLANKLLHFVSLTDSFNMLDAKLLKPLSCM